MLVPRGKEPSWGIGVRVQVRRMMQGLENLLLLGYLKAQLNNLWQREQRRDHTIFFKYLFTE